MANRLKLSMIPPKIRVELLRGIEGKRLRKNRRKKKGNTYNHQNRG